MRTDLCHQYIIKLSVRSEQQYLIAYCRNVLINDAAAVHFV